MLARQPQSPWLTHFFPEPTHSPTSMPGTLTFNIKNHLPDSNRSLISNEPIPDTAQNTISINLFKPFLFLWCAALESPGSEFIMTKPTKPWLSTLTNRLGRERFNQRSRKER
ncbi:hypothetical protein AMECASPLE_014373 [Ameca splendens]|uniref:Uncharacterized protein n=1 Tax=Ameca splendens TaxID=208324 RepID=A0ABV1A7X7_9TELE